ALAKEGAQSGVPYYLPAPLSFIKRVIHGTTLVKWNFEWTNSLNGSNTRLFFPTLQHRLLARFFTPNFYSTQFISGHGKFGSYLHRFNIQPINYCYCDPYSIQTPIHLLFECPDTRLFQEPIRQFLLN